MSCAIHQLHAQNPADFLSAPTYIGGYHIKCNGQSTGSITANPSFGTAPYTFLWNTSETTAQITNKAAGVYIVTATDSLNVSYSDTLTLTQPNNLSYQSTLSNYYGYNIEKHGHNNGSIQLAGNGGTPPYTYLWNNNDNNASRTDLTAGYYSFLITDANQCSTNGNITLTEPYPVQFNFTNVQSTQCFDGADGAATLNISGGLGDFSVVWSNGSFSLSPNDLSAGYNEVRIMERGRAIIDTGIIINSPAKLEIDITTSQYANGYHVSCVDCYNGSITTTVIGGTAPYTYLWDDENGSTTANLSNLNGGKYMVNIIDAHGCEIGNGAILRMPIAKDWSRQGNANIDPAEFIGSTDTSAVVFKTNSQEAMRLMGNGNVELAGDLKLRNLASNSFGVLGLDIDGTLKPLTGTQISETLYKSLPCPTINTDGSVDSPPGWTALALGQKYFNGLNTCGKVGVNMPSGIAPSAELEVRGSGLIKNNLTVEQDFSLWGNAHTNGNSIIDGKLGIGIVTPQYKLDVAGAVNATSFLRDGVELRGSLWSEGNPNADNICYNSGNVGIGTCNPDYLLHLKGTSTAIMLENTDASGSTIPNKFILSSANGVSRLISDHGFTFFIDSDNNEDINSNPYTEYFRVAKNASSYDNNSKDLFFINGEGTGYIRELYVQEPLSNDGKSYPDYVFDDKYNLMSLADFSSFIKKEKHLPNIPTAIDFKKENKGLAVSDMLLKLLRTQEEQALYIVQLHEQNEILKKQVELLLKK